MMKSIYFKFVFILVLTFTGSTLTYGQIDCPDGSGTWTDMTRNYGAWAIWGKVAVLIIE